MNINVVFSMWKLDLFRHSVDHFISECLNIVRMCNDDMNINGIFLMLKQVETRKPSRGGRAATISDQSPLHHLLLQSPISLSSNIWLYMDWKKRKTSLILDLFFDRNWSFHNCLHRCQNSWKICVRQTRNGSGEGRGPLGI